MLNINSIEKGIVIDHIKCGMGYKIFQLLKLDKADYTVALIMNAQSGKLGRKDMIKIENVIDIDFDILGVFDDNMTVNIIENEKTQEKQSASAFWKNLDCGEIDEEKLQDAKRAARSFLPIIILSMES